MTLIELKELDWYTYVDTDGIVKMLDFEAEYDAPGGSVECFSYVESDQVAFPWLHDYKRWFFRLNYCSAPDQIDWDDLPF